MDPTEPNDANAPPRDADPAAGDIVSCINCGYNLVGATIGKPCPECGAPIRLHASTPQKQGLAVATLVLGILSIVGCTMYGLPGVLCGVTALVLGRYAKRAIREGRSPASAMSLTKAGIICGWIGLSLGALYVIATLAFILFAIGGTAAFGGGIGAPGTP